MNIHAPPRPGNITFLEKKYIIPAENIETAISKKHRCPSTTNKKG